MSKYRFDKNTRKLTKSTYAEVVKLLVGNSSLVLKRTPKDTIEYLNQFCRFEHSRVLDEWTVVLESKDWKLSSFEGEDLVFSLYSFFKEHPAVVERSYNDRYFDV